MRLLRNRALQKCRSDNIAPGILALGKGTPVPNTSSTVLNTLGYWTDNGAAYYYSRAPGQSYAQTLSTMRNEFARKGVPLGYVQLDSWWYVKGRDQGTYRYAADPSLLPDGLAALQQRLNLPLVTHARWLSRDSPYRQQYPMSNDIPISRAYYDAILSDTSAAGAVMYEQDWLSLQARPREILADAPALLQAIATAAVDHGQTVQLCMAQPRHFLEASRWPAITTARVSYDRFHPANWDAFLYTSQLATDVGVWPWSDVFMSGEADNLLMSTLSAGIVGVGDPEGNVNAANLLHSVRGDGVIVKPDTPIVPLDASYAGDAVAAATGTAPPPMIAAARTNLGGTSAAYVVAYARGGATAYSFTPTQLGLSGNAYVYDYFAKRCIVVGVGETYSGDTANGLRYDIAVPVGRSGIAFLGATGNFASLGRARINAAADDGRVHATVAFAATEKSVQLTGYSPSRPVVTVEGRSIAVRWDAGTGIFSTQIPAQTGGAAHVVISR